MVSSLAGATVAVLLLVSAAASSAGWQPSRHAARADEPHRLVIYLTARNSHLLDVHRAAVVRSVLLSSFFFPNSPQELFWAVSDPDSPMYGTLKHRRASEGTAPVSHLALCTVYLLLCLWQTPDSQVP